jgi:hypothetical protein
VPVKAHVAVDLGSDLIRDAVLTGADVGDTLAADGLVQGDDGVPMKRASWGVTGGGVHGRP